ncbi:hypothetical protein LTR17_008629 [Elasticomyces elasticus]|nr:hypothetical protein LTR17_008629 [Elasticomyces elasticus]
MKSRSESEVYILVPPPRSRLSIHTTKCQTTKYQTTASNNFYHTETIARNCNALLYKISAPQKNQTKQTDELNLPEVLLARLESRIPNFYQTETTARDSNPLRKSNSISVPQKNQTNQTNELDLQEVPLSRPKSRIHNTKSETTASNNFYQTEITARDCKPLRKPTSISAPQKNYIYAKQKSKAESSRAIRGLQSVIFFYLSCAPCISSRALKQRKRDAERDRKDKAEALAHTPETYQHPSPSATNPYWAAEIAAGPTPNLGKGRKKKAQTNTNSPRKGNGGAAPQSNNSSPSASSTNIAQLDGRNDSKFSVGPRQRVDEEDCIGNGPTRPPKAYTKERYDDYTNPPINDMHPATVTKFTRDEVAWLMEPPPTADVMMGKARPQGTRSNSITSRPSMQPIREQTEMTDVTLPSAVHRINNTDELGEWVHQHTKRTGITHRWSMEI